MLQHIATLHTAQNPSPSIHPSIHPSINASSGRPANRRVGHSWEPWMPQTRSIPCLPRRDRAVVVARRLRKATEKLPLRIAQGLGPQVLDFSLVFPAGRNSHVQENARFSLRKGHLGHLSWTLRPTPQRPSRLPFGEY